MGKIHVTVFGSFSPNREQTFGAEEEGHAAAVAETIRWLSQVVLPNAILQDHWLQEQASFPKNRFGLGVRKKDDDQGK